MLKERFLKNRILISAYDLNPDSLSQYIKKLTKFQPVYFYGYASALYSFAKLMEDNCLFPGYRPKTVILTAETLYAHQRTEMEKVFKCPVVNEYGARDAGIIAYECPKGNM